MDLPPFQSLLDAHGRDVHRFLIASVGAVEADDCYQETWLAALRAYPRLRDASNLRGWILTVAHRKAIDHYRARARRPVPVGEPEVLAAGGGAGSGGGGGWDPGAGSDPGPGSDPAPGSHFSAGSRRGGGSEAGPRSSGGVATAPALPEDGTELWAQVAALPPKQRAALALRFVADAGYEQIATVMNTSEEAARRNVHEGLTRLRKEHGQR